MHENIPREERVRIWGERLSTQLQSGRTIRAFCEAHQLKLHTFNYWKKKLHALPKEDLKVLGPPNRFVALSQRIHGISRSPLIRLPNGVEIDLRCDLEEATHFLKNICGMGPLPPSHL